jgi:hypothetical protein
MGSVGLTEGDPILLFHVIHIGHRCGLLYRIPIVRLISILSGVVHSSCFHLTEISVYKKRKWSIEIV